MKPGDIEKKLIKLLKESSVPQSDPAARGRVLEFARTAFINSGSAIPEQGKAKNHYSAFTRLLPTLSCALAVLVAISIWRFDRGNSTEWQETIASGAIRLEQSNQLFGGQVRAIVSRGGGDQMLFSQVAQSSQRKPIIIQIEKNGERITIVTFSGEPIDFELGGEKIRLEPLVTAEGRILVSGHDFIWSTGEANEVEGLKINAAEAQI